MLLKGHRQFQEWLGDIQEIDQFRSGGMVFGKNMTVGKNNNGQVWCDRDLFWIIDENQLKNLEEEEFTIDQAIESLENILTHFECKKLPSTQEFKQMFKNVEGQTYKEKLETMRTKYNFLIPDPKVVNDCVVYICNDSQIQKSSNGIKCNFYSCVRLYNDKMYSSEPLQGGAVKGFEFLYEPYHVRLMEKVETPLPSEETPQPSEETIVSERANTEPELIP